MRVIRAGRRAWRGQGLLQDEPCQVGVMRRLGKTEVPSGGLGGSRGATVSSRRQLSQGEGSRRTGTRPGGGTPLRAYRAGGARAGGAASGEAALWTPGPLSRTVEVITVS